MASHRPDMTFAVDWALNNNYLSIYAILKRYQENQNVHCGCECVFCSSFCLFLLLVVIVCFVLSLLNTLLFSFDVQGE